MDVDLLDEDTFYVGESGMGGRYQHSFAGELECRHCGQTMCVQLNAYEYPIGAVECHDCESSGCEVLDEPSIEVDCEIPDQLLSIYEQILVNPKSVYDLQSWEFEELVADIFRRNGFDAVTTKRTRDGGRDVIATCELGGISYRTYFECKRQRPERPVGVDVVRALYGVLERDEVDKGVIVTTSYFTRDARRETHLLGDRIQLIDFEQLQRLMMEQE